MLRSVPGGGRKQTSKIHTGRLDISNPSPEKKLYVRPKDRGSRHLGEPRKLRVSAQKTRLTRFSMAEVVESCLPASVPPPAAAVGIDASDFAFQHSSPHSLKQEHGPDVLSSPPAPPLEPISKEPPSQAAYNYNFSAEVYDESSASASNTDHENEFATEDDDDATRLRGGSNGGETSSRSSISSLPASVVIHEKENIEIERNAREGIYAQYTPTKQCAAKVIHHYRDGSLGYKIKSPDGTAEEADNNSPRSPRLHGGAGTYSPAFRNPSSVRAMQMRDESVFNDDGEDDLDDRNVAFRSISRHRRRGSRMSTHSHRSSASTQTSPTKSKRTGGGSPLKNSRTSGPGSKTEFPLVLLHCTLLPPTLGTFVVQEPLNDDVLWKEVLPEMYWRRWRILREKVADNVEVRERGVLIPHPKGEYELLEERLLESLELERPRIREGHYLNNEDRQLEDEDKSRIEEGEENGSFPTSKAKCPDCGGNVSMGVEIERKWEVKVYAANGLMRAGAWGAAWSEMEKVDVEVGVWMPEEVRREVEEKLAELGVGPHVEDTEREQAEELDESERRRREVYGAPGDDDEQAQEKIDGLFDEESARHARRTPPDRLDPGHPESQYQPAPTSVQEIMLSYLNALMQDRRNLLIGFLSFLVLFYAMNTPTEISSQSSLPAQATGSAILRLQEASVEVPTTTITTTLTSISISTTLVSESVPRASPAEPSGCAESSPSVETFTRDEASNEMDQIDQRTPLSQPSEEELKEV